MLRTCIILVLCSCSAALKVQKSETATCGIVMGAFGTKKYTDIGTKVAAHIKGINISKGWCPGQPELDEVPVTYFTDAQNFTCPVGVNCKSPADMAPWEGSDSAKGQKQYKHLGSWKFRWYHAQMLINSPYDLTLYVDADALPCTGEGIAKFFDLYKKDGVTLGSVYHRSEVMSSGSSGSYGLTTKEDLKAWKDWPEHNAGVIFADMRVTKPMFEHWAQGIKRTAGHAPGDQTAYRQATFAYRNQVKEHVFKDSEVCRNYALWRYNCENGCWILHKPGMKALTTHKIIGDNEAPKYTWKGKVR